MSDPDQWWCDAYGPPDPDTPRAVDGRPRCFFSTDPTERHCADHATCTAAMTAERQRLFHSINERAARGGSVAAYLAEHIKTPEDLHRGRDTNGAQ